MGPKRRAGSHPRMTSNFASSSSTRMQDETKRFQAEFQWTVSAVVAHISATKAPVSALASGTTSRHDDAYLNAPISPDLGTIRVVFSYVEVLSVKNKWTGGRFEPQILHERSKKAIGHSVHCLRPIEELVTFVFKYRPLGLLRAEVLAPPAPREERAVLPEDVLDLDLTMDVDEDDKDDAEIKKLEARLGALKNKKKGVKREPSEVKRETKNEELIFKPGEVIDLT
ncbi:hypothetical protein DFH09DRAFT_1292323 [Mycena vulgaris]|nr:hypothetical protein DFH09DRAFT_1292323 [Mycena vulgaris]